MAVAENAGPKNDTSGQNLEAAKLRSDSAAANNDQGPPLQVEEEGRADETLLANGLDSDRKQRRRDGDDDGGHVVEDDGSGDDDRVEVVGGGKVDDDAKSVGDGGGGFGGGARNDNKGYIKSSHHDHINQQMLEMLSKLNPMAEEFVPPSLANGYGYLNNGIAYANNFAVHDNHGNGNGPTNRKKKNNYSQGRRRMTTRTSVAQREEMIRRTVYVSDIDLQVTEEHLAGLFSNCGQVVDCRVCGDPNSVLRFAFIEFTDEESARAALVLSGTVLGYYPLRVLPSKTAIAPVNPTFLPRSEDEREMCARTIYCTNIDKKVTQADVRLFFESFCGEVHRLRILGDYHHSTRIAFIEFAMAECAIAALDCSGIILGSLPIRVSPSKTPVRPRMPRSQPH